MKKVLAIALVLCLVAVLGACTPSESPPVAEEPPAQTQEGTAAPEPQADPGGAAYRIGVSVVLEGQDFWDSNVKGIYQAVADLDGRCEVVLQSAQDDPSVQLQQIENFITQGMDAIIVASVDSEAILPAVTKCNDAGIPFIYNYRPIVSTATANVDYGVGMDLIGGASDCAQWLVDYAKESGVKVQVIELMGALGDNHAIYCRDGFALVAGANPDEIEVVTQVPGEWDTAKALSGLGTALQANPDANAVFSHSDFYYSSITSALQEKGKGGAAGEDNHMLQLIVGGTMEGVNNVEAGYIDALLNCPTYEIGYQAVIDAVKILDGQITPDGQTFAEMNGFLLTKSNFDEMASKTFGAIAAAG